ncbi:phosphotransferase family protein [Streptomyces sp. NPDC004376]
MTEPVPRRLTRCGPLDLGDTRALFPTDRVPEFQVQAALASATRSPAYDGPPPGRPYDGPVAFGAATIAKAQHRLHELLDTALWFAAIGPRTGIPVPALLDHGITSERDGNRWWLVLERIDGTVVRHPAPAQQHSLGAALRGWHEQVPLTGLALDDPGGLGVMLGSARKFHPDTYPAFAELLADASRGLEMTAVHSDIAVSHNTLTTEDGRLSGILDPGAIHIAPPEFDLAWALAVDLPRGAQPAPLLDAYGRDGFDQDALDALLPLFQFRRLLDCHLVDELADARWLHDHLSRRAPHLLSLPGVPAPF